MNLSFACIHRKTNKKNYYLFIIFNVICVFVCGMYKQTNKHTNIYKWTNRQTNISVVAAQQKIWKIVLPIKFNTIKNDIYLAACPAYPILPGQWQHWLLPPKA